jgi:hypothetical protein
VTTGRTASQRLAALLAVLRRPERGSAARGRLRTPVDLSALREALPWYEHSDTGRKRLERDLGVLREIGMVQTGVLSEASGRRDAIRLIDLDKPERLELRAAEHAALGLARRHLRRGMPYPSSLPAAVAPRAERLDPLMRLLRIAEEHDDRTPVTVADLAHLLGTTRDDVRLLMAEAGGLDLPDAFVSLLLDYGGFDAEAGDAAEHDDDPTGVTITKDDALPGRSPTLNRGLDEIGRFAYTRMECDDRIALVEEAEASGWTARQPEHVGKALKTARRKLRTWRDILDSLAAPEEQAG